MNFIDKNAKMGILKVAHLPRVEGVSKDVLLCKAFFALTRRKKTAMSENLISDMAIYF